MSLGLRHLAWVRARFSGLCRATARLADGVVPLVPPPPCSPAFYPHLLCASPAQLVSSLPHAPPPVAPVGHGSSLQGPVVHCADLCPVPGVSESCAQFSALTTVLPSPPARFSVSEPAPPRRPVPGPGRLPCADGARARPRHRPSLTLLLPHSPALPAASSVCVFCFRAIELCWRNVLCR